MNQKKKLSGFSVKLSRVVKQALSHSVGFLADGLYTFRLSSDVFSLERDESPQAKYRLLVVGREHYHETVKDYPVGDVKDLKKILSAQTDFSPYQGETFHVIERLSAQSCRVLTWIIKKTSIDNLPFRPWLMVPETFCLFQCSSPSTPLTISRAGDEVTIFDGDSGFFSFLNVKEADENTLSYIKSAIPYLGHPDSNGELKAEEDAASILWRGLAVAIFSHPTSFLMKMEKSSSYPWNKAFKLSAIISALYVMVSSGLILGSNVWADYKLNEIQKHNVEVMQIRSNFRFQSSLAANINDTLKNMLPTWTVWEIFLGLQHSDTQVTAISYGNGLLTLTGTSSRATDVLAELGENKFVQSAEFSSPVRKTRDRERFIIEAKLLPMSSDVKKPLVGEQ